VRQELERCIEQPVSLGAVYATLERLENKGYVRSRAAAGGAEREGRAKRFFQVEGVGVQALRRALAAVDRLRAGLPGLKPAEVRR
jgi:DNA-binding PadR family transcriptional regulator